jgi:hypothetical protein
MFLAKCRSGLHIKSICQLEVDIQTVYKLADNELQIFVRHNNFIIFNSVRYMFRS